MVIQCHGRTIVRRTGVELSLALDKALGILGVNEENNSGDLGEVLHGDCQPVVPEVVHAQRLTSFHKRLACW